LIRILLSSIFISLGVTGSSNVTIMGFIIRLENVLEQIKTVENNLNKTLIKEFAKYLISKDTNANYQRNCVKVILMFGDFLQSSKETKETYRRQKELAVFHF
jgi:hypothetical protein